MSNISVVKDFKEILQQKDDETQSVFIDFEDMKAKAFNSGVSLISKKSGEFALTNNSFDQMTELLDIPLPYAHRIPDELLVHNFNYMINSMSNYRVRALVDDSGLVRSFSDANLPHVGFADLFKAVELAVPGEYELKYADVRHDSVSFALLPDNLQHENLLESKIFGGVKVKFSDSWGFSPSFDALIWREICANGMTSNLRSKKFRMSGKSEDEIIHQAKYFTGLALESLPDMVEGYMHLAEEKVENPRRLVTSMAAQLGIPQKVIKILLDTMDNSEFLSTIPDGKITDMSDVINLLTWVGTHNTALSEDWLDKLQGFAGKIALDHHEYCGSCGNVV